MRGHRINLKPTKRIVKLTSTTCSILACAIRVSLEDVGHIRRTQVVPARYACPKAGVV